MNDKCWKYSVSQLSQITPSGGSQDNWFVIILAVTWGTSSQVIETVAFLRFLILSHHFYSELRPDPRKCLQDHNKEWSEWNGKKDAKKYSLIIWNSKKIDINCPARYCWCNSRITIDSETDLVVDLSSTGHIYFLLSKTVFQISLPKEITTVTRSMTAAILTDRNKNLWLSASFSPTLSITSNTAVF